MKTIVLCILHTQHCLLLEQHPNLDKFRNCFDPRDAGDTRNCRHQCMIGPVPIMLCAPKQGPFRESPFLPVQLAMLHNPWHPGCAAHG